MTDDEGHLARTLVDDDAQDARERLCDQLNAALNDYGMKLFAAGNAIAGGPMKAQDPEVKDLLERIIGLSCVVQISGELGTACVGLLQAKQFYPSFALVRQIVECEYLCWAFSQDEDEARKWLKTSRRERMRFWSPRHMRQRSNGEFRDKDYAVHCEIGGHPTPAAFRLLHSTRVMPEKSVWIELTTHLANTWSHITRAIPDLILPLLDRRVGPQGTISDVTASVNKWLNSDPALAVVGKLPDFPDLR